MTKIVEELLKVSKEERDIRLRLMKLTGEFSEWFWEQDFADGFFLNRICDGNTLTKYNMSLDEAREILDTRPPIKINISGDNIQLEASNLLTGWFPAQDLDRIGEAESVSASDIRSRIERKVRRVENYKEIIKDLLEKINRERKEINNMNSFIGLTSEE